MTVQNQSMETMLNYVLWIWTTSLTKKKLIILMKGESEGNIMKYFVDQRPKMNRYIVDDGHFDKRAKRTKKFAKK